MILLTVGSTREQNGHWSRPHHDGDLGVARTLDRSIARAAPCRPSCHRLPAACAGGLGSSALSLPSLVSSAYSALAATPSCSFLLANSISLSTTFLKLS